MLDSRIRWVDIIRGYAIVLVVLGHIFTRTGTLFLESILQVEIYAFHMPLFFFISGYVYKNRGDNIWGRIKHKLNSLMVPMLIFYVIYLLFYFIKPVFGMGQAVITSKILINTILMTSDSFFNAYWFLPALFSTQVLFDLLQRIDTKNKVYFCKKTLNLASFIILFVIIMLFVISRILFSRNIMLPIGLREAMGALPFFSLGYYAKNDDKYIKKIIGCLTTNQGWHKSVFTLVSKITYIMLVAFCTFRFQYKLCSMYNSNIGNIFLFFLFGTIGIVISLLIGSVVNCSIIIKLGKNSIWIYGFHYIFLDIYSTIVNQFSCNNWILKICLDIIGLIILLTLSLMLGSIVNKLKDFWKSYITKINYNH